MSVSLSSLVELSGGTTGTNRHNLWTGDAASFNGVFFCIFHRYFRYAGQRDRGREPLTRKANQESAFKILKNCLSTLSAGMLFDRLPNTLQIRLGAFEQTSFGRCKYLFTKIFKISRQNSLSATSKGQAFAGKAYLWF